MPRSIPRNLLLFLQKLDDHLPANTRVPLYVGGAGALLLAYDGQVATDDVDFIGERTGLLLELSEFAGKDSEVHQLTNYYLDIVPPGWFPNAWGWSNRAVPTLIPGLSHIDLRVLELHDLIISKLKRFGSGDREDIRNLCNHPELDVEILRQRYQEARELYDYDQRERMDDNFRLVEVEILGLEPTEFT